MIFAAAAGDSIGLRGIALDLSKTNPSLDYAVFL